MQIINLPKKEYPSVWAWYSLMILFDDEVIIEWLKASAKSNKKENKKEKNKGNESHKGNDNQKENKKDKKHKEKKNIDAMILTYVTNLIILKKSQNMKKK